MRLIYHYFIIFAAIYIDKRSAKKFELFPYNPTDWSSIKLFIHQYDPFPLYSSIYQQWIPKHFLPNFTDLAYVMGPKLGPHPTLAELIKRSIENLAKLTNTDTQCYQALPGNISNIPALMGRWYITAKLGLNLVDEKSDSSIVHNAICEEVLYTQTGPYTFDKVANDHYHGKWITITGTGKFVTPAVTFQFFACNSVKMLK